METPSLTSKCCDALIIIDIHNSCVIIILNIFCLAATFVFGLFPIVGPSTSLPCCFLCLQPTVSYKNTEVSQIRNLAKKHGNPIKQIKPVGSPRFFEELRVQTWCARSRIPKVNVEVLLINTRNSA